MLIKGNTLSNHNYEAKKILCSMGMEYKKLHAYPNDCILYTKEFEVMHDVGSHGMKKKDGDSSSCVSTKGLLAKNLKWHVNERKCDGQFRYVANSIQWKKIDIFVLDFNNEPRNLKFILATNGMNLYAYSTYDLQLGSLVMNKAQTRECCGMKALMCLMGSVVKISRYMSCYFASSMTFQHTKICPSTMLSDIKHVLYLKKAHATIKWYMKGRLVTLAIKIFSKIIICFAD
ncbi:hypothetical protein CR513_49679, partial [Mucuna pruriens]